MPFKPFGVGENWDSTRTIENWTNEANAWSDNPVSAFDFSLRTALKLLCDSYGFSLRDLVARIKATGEMRVSINRVGSLTREGVVSSQQALTHLKDLSSQELIGLIEKAKEFLGAAR